MLLFHKLGFTASEVLETERIRFTDVTSYVISSQSAFVLTSHGSSPYAESCRMNDQNLCLVLRVGWTGRNKVQYLPEPPSLHPFL